MANKMLEAREVLGPGVLGPRNRSLREQFEAAEEQASTQPVAVQVRKQSSSKSVGQLDAATSRKQIRSERGFPDTRSEPDVAEIARSLSQRPIDKDVMDRTVEALRSNSEQANSDRYESRLKDAMGLYSGSDDPGAPEMDPPLDPPELP